MCHMAMPLQVAIDISSYGLQIIVFQNYSIYSGFSRDQRVDLGAPLSLFKKTKKKSRSSIFKSRRLKMEAFTCRYLGPMQLHGPCHPDLQATPAQQQAANVGGSLRTPIPEVLHKSGYEMVADDNCPVRHKLSLAETGQLKKPYPKIVFQSENYIPNER